MSVDCRLCVKFTELAVDQSRQSVRRLLNGMDDPSKLVLHDPVALTRVLFQALAVDDRDLTPAVTDQLRVRQIVGGFRDARARGAQHVREALLRHQERVRLDPVAADEEPAAKSRLGRVKVVADRRL